MLVSIPPWFDFAYNDAAILVDARVVSIPPWFDFAVYVLQERVAITVFQSHLGSILPHTLIRQSLIRQSFQSHLGSILP